MAGPRQILITGGAGFIGGHLARRALAANHGVRILDNLSEQIHGAQATFDPPPGADFIRGDINDRHDVERALEGVDTVVHLAAETGTGQSMYEIDRYYRVNVQGTALIFDVLANSPHCVRNFVLASSRSVYGEGAYLCHSCDLQGARRFPPMRTRAQLEQQVWTAPCPSCGGRLEPTATREDDPLAPASVYAATKLAQEDVVRVACRALAIGHSILRFQNVFGEGQSLSNPYTGILSIFSTRIRLGQSLPVFEDGDETRDFVHVDDVAAAVMACVEQASVDGVTLNVGLGEAVSIMTVARLLQQLMGSPIEPHVTGQYRVGDIRHNFADISRLREVAGMSPGIGLQEGLTRFCDWVATQPIPQDLLDKANAELRTRGLMT